MPVYILFRGWRCVGYRIEQPLAPDPFSLAYYQAFFWFSVQGGECFGMCSNILHFYNSVSAASFDPKAVAPGDLNNAIFSPI
jgi:hypothetical protein